MADIKKVNVGGLDYNVKDDTARTNATTALSHEAYVENGNTASQAYAIIGTPINWKGTLYHTKTAVAAGATWVVGTNLTAVPNLGKMISSIKTYVGSDGKLHFVDGTGADSVLPFSGTGYDTMTSVSMDYYNEGTTQTTHVPKDALMVFISEYPSSGASFITPQSGAVSIGAIERYRDRSYGKCHVLKATADTQTFTCGLNCNMAYII